MEQAKIDRINELARKAKSGIPLTEEEQLERARLRKEYLDEFRANMTGVLDRTVIVRPDGSKERLKPKSSSAHSRTGNGHSKK